MKRINLIPEEPFFPLKIAYQRAIVYPLILVILVYYLFSFLEYKKELDNINNSIISTKTEIQNMKDSITKKTSYIEKASVLEKEFLSVKEDYEILKKNMHIKTILTYLTKITPENLWIISISYSADNDKIINILGRSLTKEEIFQFLSNCQNLARNTELIEINNEGNFFNFHIKVDSVWQE